MINESAWSPIRAAPDPKTAGSEGHEAYNEDLAIRLASILERYGCEPSEAGWRRLALHLAIGHHEPGFELAIRVRRRKPQEDEQWRWVQMMDKHLAFDREKTPFGTWDESSGLKKCNSAATAAALVARFLQREWQTSGQVGKEPPEPGHLKNLYSDHKRRRVRNDALVPPGNGSDPVPELLEDYLARLGVFARLMSIPPDLIEARQGHQKIS